VQLQVERAFRLKEVNRNLGFHDVLAQLDKHVRSAQHVKFWWYPAKDIIRASYYDQTNEASRFFRFPLSLFPFFYFNALSQPKNHPSGSWFRDILLGFHLLQFSLFVARYFLPLNNVVTGFALWATGGDFERVDESYKAFNVDCRVSPFCLA
jgi:L-gulonolactone oxidase